MSDGSEGLAGEHLNGFRFEPRKPPAPPTLDEVNAFLKAAEKLKQRILCAPDAFERIDRLVRDEGYGAVFKAIPCVWLEPGQVVVMQSEADDEAYSQGAGMRVLDEITERWRRQAEADERCRRYELDLLSYRAAEGAPSWLITGL